MQKGGGAGGSKPPDRAGDVPRIPRIPFLGSGLKDVIL